MRQSAGLGAPKAAGSGGLGLAAAGLASAKAAVAKRRVRIMAQLVMGADADRQGFLSAVRN